MRNLRASAIMALAATVAATPAGAYYHYVHYLQSPYNTPIFEKFDLTQLPNQTVTFLVTDPGPAKLGANDDFASVLSQVRQAAAIWNGVSGSSLRVAFGGEQNAIQAPKAANGSSDLAASAVGAGSTPAGDVLFVDLPPGLLGMGGVTAASTPVTNSGGTFFPVIRSTILLTNDTSVPPGPSYMESFFTTAVHEMGHALGLQHSFVGGAMSYSVVRNTTHARPIGQDDIAGLSMLYGGAAYAATVGSIAGQVTSNGQPVSMASVVAITPVGDGISTLSNPDGSYRIDGLPPGNYWVYVHPLPPDADIRGPYDPNGNAIPWSGPFETLFYPGTRNPQQFGLVGVAPGTPATGVNFSVGARSAVPMYDITTYSFAANGAYAAPARVNGTKATVNIAAQSFVGDTPVPQSITVLGGLANPQFVPYNSPVALAIYLQLPLIPSIGPRHILFNFGNDMYVLPGGLTLVEKDPPAITSVTANADGTVTIAGTNLSSASSVYFDGLPTINQALSSDGGSITVTPPPGYSGQSANVIVYNLDDGQNSTIYQTQGPPAYTYPVTGAPQLAIAQTGLPAGVASIIDIVGQNNLQLVDGQITVGFGTSDISVLKSWVIGPNHIVANAIVSPGATAGATPLSVISGFQRVFEPQAFQIQAANPALPQISLPLVNNDPNQPTLYPGAAVTIFGSNLGSSPAAIQLTLHGLNVPIAAVGANQISFVIPAQVPLGLTTLTLNNGSATSPAIVVEIAAAPPVITAVNNMAGQAVNAGNPASNGSTLFATVANANPAAVSNPSLVQVAVGGVPMAVLQVTAIPNSQSIQVAFQIGQSFGGATVPVVVAINGARTDPYSMVVN